MQRLLETAAYVACARFGASHLVIDRSTGGESCVVRLAFDTETTADLWDLDPLLWDDAQWAGVRAVRAGEVRTVQPVLHKD
jgi:hypothetical protein